VSSWHWPCASSRRRHHWHPHCTGWHARPSPLIVIDIAPAGTYIHPPSSSSLSSHQLARVAVPLSSPSSLPLSSDWLAHVSPRRRISWHARPSTSSTTLCHHGTGHACHLVVVVVAAAASCICIRNLLVVVLPWSFHALVVVVVAAVGFRVVVVVVAAYPSPLPSFLLLSSGLLSPWNWQHAPFCHRRHRPPVVVTATHIPWSVIGISLASSLPSVVIDIVHVVVVSLLFPGWRCQAMPATEYGAGVCGCQAAPYGCVWIEMGGCRGTCDSKRNENEVTLT